MTPGRDLDWDAARRRQREPAACVPVRGDRSALHPLHLGHDRPAQGRRARQRRPRRGARVEHAERLRRAPGRGLLGGLRRRLGRRALLHRLRAAARRRDDDPVRGQAGRHARRGRVLARDRASTAWRALFTAPTAIRAIRKEDPEAALLGGRDLPSLRTLFLAGERTDPDTYDWASRVLGRPVIDHWWQTETGWAIAANCRGLEPPPVKAGLAEPARARLPHRRPGRRRRASSPPGEQGAIAVRLPLPPGTLPTLWNDDERCVASYLARYPGLVPDRATAGTSTRTATCS